MTSGAIFGLGATLRANSNSNIPGKYSDTHFRIDGNGYNGNGNNPWPEHVESAYVEEVRSLFVAHGWIIEESDRSYAAVTVTKGRNSLYLHPQDFSGVCENAERESLLEALKNASTFNCGKVDVYEEIHDMTDEQLTDLLESKREVIKTELLEKLTTKRRNLYVTDIGFFGVCGNIAKEHSVKRLAIDGKESFNGEDECTVGLCNKFVCKIFDELVDSGKIVTAQTKNGLGYRTAKKGDKVNLKKR